MCRNLVSLALGCFLLETLFTGTVHAQPGEWKTGQAFRDELDEPLVASWSNAPLRTVLNSLAKQRRVAIWLDRRVDPDKLVDFAPRDLPLRDALDQLAEHVLCKTAVVDSVLYVGPARSTANLATLAAVKRAEVQRLPKGRSTKLLVAKPSQWPERAEPRTLVQQLLDEAEVAATNRDEAVTHDLWPARDLPPLPWCDRLTLMLAGFGATFEFSEDGRTIGFVPWPDKISYERSYSVTGDAKTKLEALRTRYPDAELRLTGSQLAVKGRFEDHEQIARLLRGDSVARKVKTTTGAGKKTFTLNVERQPLGPLAKTLAERLSLQIEFDPGLEARQGDLITFKVTEASVEEVWAALAKSAGINAQVQGTKVTLRPAP